MKSLEQMGGSSEQPEGKLEDLTNEELEQIMRKAADSKEGTKSKEWQNAAEEMTRRRRKDFGLGEARELTAEESAEIERSIEKLLSDLSQYDLESFSPEIQDEICWAEQEANEGKDRELAKANLERVIKILQGEVERQKK